MHISINTDEALSDVDKQILAVLAGGVSAPKASPAPAAEAAPKSTPKASKPVEEPEEAADEPAEEESTEESGTTLEEAVALATKMVSNGEAKKVKEALGTVGAKKVSEIPADKVDEFVAALG